MQVVQAGLSFRAILGHTVIHEYKEVFDTVSSKWSSVLLEYYQKNIDQDLIYYSYGWVLEKLTLHTATSGITNNISESYNRVLQSVCRSYYPADLMVISANQNSEEDMHVW